MRTDRLGIDFGTSNTAAAVMVSGRPSIVPLEPEAETLPTAVFFDGAARSTLYGTAATAALIEGREGRFMRALKSVLGTPLMHERRQFLTERLTLIDVVGRFLAHIKARAEAHCNQPFPHALSGRPVRFHSTDATRNTRALEDLRQCYAAAGFESVSFLPEPEAAALASGLAQDAQVRPKSRGLIVDIGGGTSDFTVFDSDAGAITIRASHGVRIGGTDFDRRLSLDHIMPLLGKDSLLRAQLGSQTHRAPVSLFNDLATWEKIAFVYGGATSRDVARMARLAVEPEKFARLQEVVDMHLGHDLAFAAERGKIDANRGTKGSTIDLRVLERDLTVPLAPAGLAAALSPFAQQIAQAATRTLALAETEASQIDQVVMVGGSGLLAVVQEAMITLLPRARLVQGRAFTAIVDGLAIAAAREDIL